MPLRMIFLNRFHIPVVLGNIADRLDRGAGTGFGGDDGKATQDGFGANFNFIDAGDGAAWRIDEQLHPEVLHEINDILSVFGQLMGQRNFQTRIM